MIMYFLITLIFGKPLDRLNKNIDSNNCALSETQLFLECGMENGSRNENRSAPLKKTMKLTQKDKAFFSKGSFLLFFAARPSDKKKEQI